MNTRLGVRLSLIGSGRGCRFRGPRSVTGLELKQVLSRRSGVRCRQPGPGGDRTAGRSLARPARPLADRPGGLRDDLKLTIGGAGLRPALSDSDSAAAARPVGLHARTGPHGQPMPILPQGPLGASHLSVRTWPPGQTLPSQHSGPRALPYKYHHLGGLASSKESMGKSETNPPLRRAASVVFAQQLSGTPLTVVVLGASGDLAKKKIFPSLYTLFSQGYLPPKVNIVGYARSQTTAQELASKLDPFIKKSAPNDYNGPTVKRFFDCIDYVAGPYDHMPADLNATISKWEAANKGASERRKSSIMGSIKSAVKLGGGKKGANRLFYLALPPSVYPDVLRELRANAMGSLGWNRVVIEKPFGHDLASALELSKHIGGLFSEEEIYRMDHYLGKELVQNLIVLRFANRFFESSWNKENVKMVTITFKEPFGVEGRGGYFDKSGIIRDILQNHLMQIFSLVAMEKPESLAPEHVRDAKVRVLKDVKPIERKDVIVGQYAAAGGKPGYLDDEGVPKNSITPTFAMIVLYINNPRWQGVPFVLKAGKALDDRKAEIRVQMKDQESDIFENNHRNELVMRVQPDEAVYMKISTKTPGFKVGVDQGELDLTYGDRYSNVRLPDAYERLLLDVIRGDRQSFVRNDELEESWKIFDPILAELEKKKAKPEAYAYGSRGPASADKMVESLGFVRNDKYTWTQRK